jgi:hypothetical protein
MASFVALDFPVLEAMYPTGEHTAYLLHNLWDYSGSVSLRNDRNESVFSFQLSRTINMTDPESQAPPNAAIPTPFPSLFYTREKLSIYCPERTLITDKLRLYDACGTAPGWPFELRGHFETLELGSVKYSDVGGAMKIVFENLTGVPRNYVDIPQMYWMSYRASPRETLIGIGSTIIAVLSCIGGALEGRRERRSD